jgi:ABC-type branched-subunit amino acid transport system ATPase component
MLLSLSNIYAGYDGSDVLKGVTIHVEQGTTTCIVGPNGAGKSTVLRTLSGLLRPRLGEITFDNRSIIGLNARQILALGIVQVPQSHSLFPSMTVQQNVRLGAYTVRDSALVERRLHEVAEMFPVVKTRAHDKAGSLSGGQQRLGRIRALPDAGPSRDLARRAVDGAGPQDVQAGDRDD